ncbi:MAG: JAB domain-containing protein, partial [Thermoanaerobaculia bacterium]
NHPSGDPSASGEDERYTRRTRDSLKLIDIKLIDHVIAGAHAFTSLAQKGVI